MSNDSHVSYLQQGVGVWNAWRRSNPDIRPDLRGAQLQGLRVCGGEMDAAHYSALVEAGVPLHKARRDGADLRNVDFRGANLIDANLSLCDLSGADLSETVMSRALLGSCRMHGTNFYWACMEKIDANNAQFDNCDLSRANLAAADLCAAHFQSCSLVETSLFQADLSSTQFHQCSLEACDLTYSRLVRTVVEGGRIVNCGIYGVSVWDVHANGVEISELCITPDGQAKVTVDDLDVAQFLYLVLENKRLRGVIETMTGKMVLILGRFTPERKSILDFLRAQLRNRGFVSVLFDFDKPAGRDLTETVSLLAHMSSFILADITDPKSIPQELQKIVPSLPSVPVQPLVLADASVYSMFQDFGAYPTVLTPFVYKTEEELFDGLVHRVIPAIKTRLAEIQARRAQFEAALRSLAQPPRSV